MQKIAIIQISEAGSHVASIITSQLDAQIIQRAEVSAVWTQFDAFVFIGAMGICVRTIAPLLRDKHTDPAVICIDSMGQNVISVLSGHVGGANDLTRQIAGVLGTHDVITTQSDQAGLWALDTLTQRFNWKLMNTRELNVAIAIFVSGQPTALFMDVRDAGTDYLEQTLPPHVTVIDSLDEMMNGHFKLLIAVTPFAHSHPTDVPELHFVPCVASCGLGLAHHAEPVQEIEAAMHAAFAERGILPCAKEYCTIDMKADEPFIRELQARGERVRFFTADELADVTVPNPSLTVQQHVGTPSVCEAAALLASNNGLLVVPKTKGKNWTAALAIDRRFLRMGEGHIEIVGAGPGAPDLISVRGRQLLERADLILYAGSLVPRELTEYHKLGAVVRNSASMTLEEQCTLMKEHYIRGHLIVRLHTGDPCIFGAIQEQMAFFDREGLSYHITPGISSFLAAAAELRSQFTIPERKQTIILTRGQGRTPMPEKEQLHLLAKSQSTMCIFLSAAIVDDVQQELLTEYPKTTPVAACYHLTWSDQRIYRGVLKDLARIVHDNNLTLTTMIVVGEAIDNREGLSELYNSHFTHLYRKGNE